MLVFQDEDGIRDVVRFRGRGEEYNFFFFQAADGESEAQESRGLGDLKERKDNNNDDDDFLLLVFFWGGGRTSFYIVHSDHVPVSFTYLTLPSKKEV